MMWNVMVCLVPFSVCDHHAHISHPFYLHSKNKIIEQDGICFLLEKPNQTTRHTLMIMMTIPPHTPPYAIWCDAYCRLHTPNHLKIFSVEIFPVFSSKHKRSIIIIIICGGISLDDIKATYDDDDPYHHIILVKIYGAVLALAWESVQLCLFPRK